jgi:Na+-transporting methylmalonyl-CoA/oxaloacetate decarboxylase gamma subunit
MSGNILLALQITVVGMGLVFGAILLLWLLMALLVRFTSARARVVGQPEVDDRKRRAAVAAVTIALARQASTGPRPFPLPPTAIVSAWQAVTRANHLNRRGRVR